MKDKLSRRSPTSRMMVPLVLPRAPTRGDGEASRWHAHVCWLSVVCVVLERNGCQAVTIHTNF